MYIGCGWIKYYVKWLLLSEVNFGSVVFSFCWTGMVEPLPLHCIENREEGFSEEKAIEG